jgi:hypothetical protein
MEGILKPDRHPKSGGKPFADYPFDCDNLFYANKVEEIPVKQRALSAIKCASSARFLPCLRCGHMTVAAIIPRAAKELKIGDLECKRCSAPHYLLARKQNGFWPAVYDRDTRRYPFDHYDEFPHFRMDLRHVSTNCPGDGDAPHPQYRPIVVYKRKRFSATEVRQIWIQSGRKCPLCRKPWKLHERSRTGWHIDHIIPISAQAKKPK